MGIQRTLWIGATLTLAIMLSGPLFGADMASARGGAPVAYRLYFGDLHTHTGYSDAYEESTPWDAYKAAIDAGADFMAVTDHVAVWHGYEAWIMDDAEWSDSLAAADYYTSRRFVAMPGYEAWMLGQCGEVNVYNTRNLPLDEPMGYKFDRLANMYDWISQQPGAIGQFNHPLYVSDNFLDFGYYSPSRDIGMNVLEVYNDEFTEESYVMALDAGWHVMPSANSDTHYADWISNHEMRTVLLAESLSADNLYSAMSACRGYATLDKNLRITYSLNGAVMGSTLASPASAYSASVHIEDPDGVPADEITMVEVVSDGGVVVARIQTSGLSVDLTIPLSSDIAQYYYIRVSTASALGDGPGVTAWTAPVWTGR